MKPISFVLLIALAGLIQSCAHPQTAKIEQKDSRPAIGVSGAPEESLLYVDGLKMGLANRFDGKAGVLMVESGNHTIDIRTAGGNVLFSQDLFLSSSTTKVIPFNP
ncbi:MAG: hypothetical protein V3V05_02570 [Pontiella sp.]